MCLAIESAKLTPSFAVLDESTIFRTLTWLAPSRSHRPSSVNKRRAPLQLSAVAYQQRRGICHVGSEGGSGEVIDTWDSSDLHADTDAARRTKNARRRSYGRPRTRYTRPQSVGIPEWSLRFDSPV